MTLSITLTTIKPTINPATGAWEYRPFILTRDDSGFHDRPAPLSTNQDEINRLARQLEELAK